MTVSMFRVFRSEWYDGKLRKLDKSEVDRVCKFEQELKEEPYSGKPLGYRFFREKKFNGKRVIFLVYEDYSAVFLVTITDKKTQRHDIELVKEELDKYKESIRKLVERI